MAEYLAVVTGKAGVGGRIAELDNAEIGETSWELNGAGASTLTLPADDPKAQALKVVTREVQIWRDSVLLHWLVPWRIQADKDKVTVSLEGLWSYFFKRFLVSDLAYVATDQHAIGWNLVNYAQATLAGGNLGITSAAFAASGINRDRSYLGDEHGNIGDLVKSFTNLENGFDFDIEVFGDGGRKWTPYYPSKGVNRPNMVMEWGRNLLDYRYSVDGSRMANRVIATGSGEGDQKLEADVVDVAARDANVLLMQVAAESTIKEQATLTAKANELVRLWKNPIALPEIQVDNSVVPIIGVLQTGDTVPVRINHGFTQIDGTYRVVAMKLDPAADRMWVTLN